MSECYNLGAKFISGHWGVTTTTRDSNAAPLRPHQSLIGLYGIQRNVRFGSKADINGED